MRSSMEALRIRTLDPSWQQSRCKTGIWAVRYLLKELRKVNSERSAFGHVTLELANSSLELVNQHAT